MSTALPAAHKEVTAKLLADSAAFTMGYAYATLAVDISSWLLVLSLAWFTTYWIPIGAFVPMALAAGYRVGFRQVLQSPFLILLPGWEVLPKPRLAAAFRFFGLWLRIGCLVCFYWALGVSHDQFMTEYGKDLRHHGPENPYICGPSWLQRCCLEGRIDVQEYEACKVDMPWYLETSCSSQAASVCVEQLPWQGKLARDVVFSWPFLALLFLMGFYCQGLACPSSDPASLSGLDVAALRLQQLPSAESTEAG